MNKISFDSVKTGNRKYPILLTGTLAMIVVLYLPVFKNHLTNWDDEMYIVNNPYLRVFSWNNVKNIFTSYYAGNYHPLTQLSLLLNYHTDGINPWTYQLTNIILHLVNTLLVYIFIRDLLLHSTSKKINARFIALLSATLFGIHPMQVESVAWISERKNVLYTCFFLSSLISYISYLKNKKKKYFVSSIAFFILSLLSKGMAVPLPLCLIGIDYFTGRKLLSKKVILEKAPYFVLAILFGTLAILAQRSGNAFRDTNNLSFINQIAVACYGFLQYLVNLGFPHHLSAFYPYPLKSGNSLPFSYYASLVIIPLTLIILLIRFRKNRYFVFSTLFFIANIGIVIQLLPVGDAVMADRYVYVPSIGFFLLPAFYLHLYLEKKNLLGKSLFCFLVLYLSVLGVKTFLRVGIWKDSMTLWEDSLKNYPDNNDRALQNRGNVFFERGNYSKALNDYNQILNTCVSNKKSYSKALIGRARVKQVFRDYEGAMEDFNVSLGCFPSYDAYLDRAVLKLETGDLQGAQKDLEMALHYDPLSTAPLINKGGICYQLGLYSEALKNYNLVLDLDPLNYKASVGKGQVKQALNDFEGALADFDKSLSCKESYEGYLNRAVLKIEMKKYREARSDLDKAFHLDSLSSELFINRGVIELNCGNTQTALKEFTHAVVLDSTNYLTYLYRAIAKNYISDYTGAITDLNVSIRLHPSAEAFYYRGQANSKLGRKFNRTADLRQSAQMGNHVASEELKNEQ